MADLSPSFIASPEYFLDYRLKKIRYVLSYISVPNRRDMHQRSYCILKKGLNLLISRSSKKLRVKNMREIKKELEETGKTIDLLIRQKRKHIRDSLRYASLTPFEKYLQIKQSNMSDKPKKTVEVRAYVTTRYRDFSDVLVAEGHYKSRGDVVRHAMTSFFEGRWGELYGTICRLEGDWIEDE